MISIVSTLVATCCSRIRILTIKRCPVYVQSGMRFTLWTAAWEGTSQGCNRGLSPRGGTIVYVSKVITFERGR